MAAKAQAGTTTSRRRGRPAREAVGADRGTTRDAILDAAEAAFARLGFGDASLGEIAAAAGVTKSLIHHYFASKQDLWREVVDRRFHEYYAWQSSVLDTSEFRPRDLVESARMLFRFLANNPSLVKLHRWAHAGDGPVQTELGHDLTARGVALLRRGQADGTVRDDIDAAALLATVFCLVEGWFQAREEFTQRFGADFPGDDDYLETITRIVLRGMEARPKE